MIERSFWRGFPPMLASFCLRALLVQLDLTMIAGLGAGALAGYVLVSRVAVLDAALTVAVGSVSLLVVSRAQTVGVTKKLLTEIWLCAGLLGFAAAAIGALGYPLLIDWLARQDPAGEFARSAIFIYISATPIRMVESAAIFVLHSLGRSGVILGWQLCEIVAKAALNLTLISSFGFMGCFIASVIVEILSLVWALIVIRRIVTADGEGPAAGFRASFLRGCIVEFDARAGATARRFRLIRAFRALRGGFGRIAAPRRLRRGARPDRAGPCTALGGDLVFRHALFGAIPR